MTRAQMRVAIAKDVLKQISLHRIKIRAGGYWSIGPSGPSSFIYNIQPVGQEEIKEKHCTVCAAGAAVTSAIRLFNEEKISTRNSCDDDAVFIAGRRWFTKRQLAMIEAAFEDPGARPMVEHITFHEIDRCEQFAERNKSSIGRAKAIFENIIENRGNFVP